MSELQVPPTTRPDGRAEVHLRDRVLTFTGVSAYWLNQVEALRTAWWAGKTGGVDLVVVDWNGPHQEQFNYEDIVRIKIESGRSR